MLWIDINTHIEGSKLCIRIESIALFQQLSLITSMLCPLTSEAILKLNHAKVLNPVLNQNLFYQPVFFFRLLSTATAATYIIDVYNKNVFEQNMFFSQEHNTKNRFVQRSKIFYEIDSFGKKHFHQLECFFSTLLWPPSLTSFFLVRFKFIKIAKKWWNFFW